MRDRAWAKLLRIIGIIFMSLTAAVTLLAGIGTTCVALNPTGFGDTFAGIAPFQWLYILFVLITVAIGVLGIRATVLLVRGKKNAYRNTLIALISGIVIGGIHMFASRSLRGNSMPVDGVVYVTVLTLIIFLIFRIPKIWQGVNFEKPATQNDGGRNAASFALIASGLLTLTIQFPMAPTHTINGINYADAWHATLSVIGSILILIGIITGIKVRKTSLQARMLKQPE